MVNTNDKWQSIIGVQKIKGAIFKFSQGIYYMLFVSNIINSVKGGMLH